MVREAPGTDQAARPARTPPVAVRLFRLVVWSAAMVPVILFFWEIWEVLWAWWHKVRRRAPVSIAMPYGTCSVWLQPSRYRAYTCADGTRIVPGDPVLELHLRSPRLARIRRNKQRWWRYVEEDFAAIAGWLAVHPEVRALVGITVLERTIRHFGAETQPRRDALYTRLVILHLEGFVRLFHPNGKERVRRRYYRLVEDRISRRAFMTHYLKRAAKPSRDPTSREDSRSGPAL